MSKWKLSEKKLKKYPHFDAVLSVDEATKLVTDPTRVAKHPFYPFILYHQKWNKYAPVGALGEKKERPIRYAARSDAYIFSYYRWLLSKRYEEWLNKNGISQNILAYRRIVLPGSKSGASSIDFAEAAFRKIGDLGTCCVISLDISSFFESLDHSRIKDLWCRLLEVDRLPPDHFAVFRAITNYAVVDKIDAYKRLGIFGEKKHSKTGKPISGYLVSRKDMKRRLCSSAEFRSKIAGGDGHTSIIRKNKDTFGVPQGAPLSDLLANVYLLDFDIEVSKFVATKSGLYFRYSDDILIVLPCSSAVASASVTFVKSLIAKTGSKIKIQDKKTTIHRFFIRSGKQNCERILGDKARNGLEYLGLRFDGQHVYLRDSTLSALYRKIATTAKVEVLKHIKRYGLRPPSEMAKSFDYDGLIKKFGRVEDFSDLQPDFKRWTFWTYAHRAELKIGAPRSKALSQLKKLRSNIKKRVQREFDAAYAKSFRS